MPVPSTFPIDPCHSTGLYPNLMCSPNERTFLWSNCRNDMVYAWDIARVDRYPTIASAYGTETGQIRWMCKPTDAPESKTRSSRFALHLGDFRKPPAGRCILLCPGDTELKGYNKSSMYESSLRFAPCSLDAPITTMRSCKGFISITSSATPGLDTGDMFYKCWMTGYQNTYPDLVISLFLALARILQPHRHIHHAIISCFDSFGAFSIIALVQ